MATTSRLRRWTVGVLAALIAGGAAACGGVATTPGPLVTSTPLATLRPTLAPTPAPSTTEATPEPTTALAPPVYQTPGGLLQLDWRLQPTAPGAGFLLTAGMNGYKVMVVRDKLGLGTDGAGNTVDAEMIAAVEAYQRGHDLEVDGIVGPITWAAMGFSASSWTGLDTYVAPLVTDPAMTRDEHIEALVAEAMRYDGSRYVWGGTNDPNHGADCSGMILQAMYAIGLDPDPIDTVKHAEPTYRTSRELYAHPKLLHVPVAERERGDLLFWANDGGIYHTAIYLGDGMMIEATPPQGRVTQVRMTNLQPEVVRLLP